MQKSSKFVNNFLKSSQNLLTTLNLMLIKTSFLPILIEEFINIFCKINVASNFFANWIWFILHLFGYHRFQASCKSYELLNYFLLTKSNIGITLLRFITSDGFIRFISWINYGVIKGRSYTYSIILTPDP